MENVIVLKDKDFGAASTDDANTLRKSKNLAVGAMGIYTPDGKIITFAEDALDTDLTGVDEVTLAYNNGGTVFKTKPIRRKGIKNIFIKDYSAPVSHKVVVSNLLFEDSDVGHVGIRVADNDFTSLYATSSINASVYKKHYMTKEDVIDKLVEALNKATNMNVTAVKSGSTGSFKITITSKKRGQFMVVGADGLAEGCKIESRGEGTSVLPDNGSGVAEDLRKLEIDAMVYKGDGGYIERGEEMYNKQVGTVLGTNYDITTFTENLPSPRNRTNSLNVETTIAFVNGATSTVKAKVNNFLTEFKS